MGRQSIEEAQVRKAINIPSKTSTFTIRDRTWKRNPSSFNELDCNAETTITVAFD